MANNKSKAKALLGEARRLAAKQSEAAVRVVDEKTDGKVSETLGSGSRLGKDAIAKVHDATRSGVEKGAETDAGATALRGAKKTLDVLSGVPVLTAIGDTVSARQGTNGLLDQLRQNPFDPMPPVWLAEAILRANREQRGVNAARAVINPLRVPLQVAAKAVVTANEDHPAVPAVTQLLGRSYVLALARLEEATTAHELHALSRVYLARGAPDEAVRLAQGAIALDDDEQAQAAITLARAHGQRGAFDQAWEAGKLAVAAGSSYGNQILAELPAAIADSEQDHSDQNNTGRTSTGRRHTRSDRDPGMTGRNQLTAEERAALLALVSNEDVVRYRGVAPDAGDVVADVLTQQRDRFRVQGAKLKQAGGRLRGKVAGDD